MVSKVSIINLQMLHWHHENCGNCYNGKQGKGEHPEEAATEADVQTRSEITTIGVPARKVFLLFNSLSFAS